MMIPARASRLHRAPQTEATRAVQGPRNRIISVRHISRACRNRIYDSVVSSFRHRDANTAECHFFGDVVGEVFRATARRVRVTRRHWFGTARMRSGRGAVALGFASASGGAGCDVGIHASTRRVRLTFRSQCRNMCGLLRVCSAASSESAAGSVALANDGVVE